jgi:hypothetical protein
LGWQATTMTDWSDEETTDPLVADVRNFYKVEKWTRDGSKVDRAVAGLGKLARRLCSEGRNVKCYRQR